MDDDTLLRYSRQIMLPAIGIEGQEKLQRSRALIIGLGGLGSPVSMYLATAGVGRMTLVDFDTVDLSNLQRQIVHTTDRIGEPKAGRHVDELRHAITHHQQTEFFGCWGICVERWALKNHYDYPYEVSIYRRAAGPASRSIARRSTSASRASAA